MFIGEIGKSKDKAKPYQQVIRVSLEGSRSKSRVDVRVYYQREDGEWVPTRRGVNIPFNSMGVFMALMKKADELLTSMPEKEPATPKDTAKVKKSYPLRAKIGHSFG